MKKYEDIWVYGIENKLREGKKVYVYDKETHKTINAEFMGLGKYLEMREDKDDRYFAWVVNEDTDNEVDETEEMTEEQENG